MAIEEKRGCGFRRVGGLYLCGEFIPVPCDRLPLEAGHCPVCSAGIHFSRNYARINPFKLWGVHPNCQDRMPLCSVCVPRDETAFLMMVGVKHYPTPQDFMEEGRRLGFSKRIPTIPKGLELGKTVVYLAHPRAVEVKRPAVLQQAMGIVEGLAAVQAQLLDTEHKPEYRLGVFCAFVPQRIEKIVKASEATPELVEKLAKVGVTAVPVPDDDPDHK